jgi:hypothetical protein
VSAAEATAQSLIDVWASEVRRLVPEVRALRQQYDLDLQRVEEDVRRLNEGKGGDWSLGEHYTYATWRRFWAAQHHLVWAAHQLERWVRRLARERGTPEPDPTPCSLSCATPSSTSTRRSSTGTSSPQPGTTRGATERCATCPMRGSTSG